MEDPIKRLDYAIAVLKGERENRRQPAGISESPSLAEINDYGVDRFCWCNECSHNDVVAIEVLIRALRSGVIVPVDAWPIAVPGLRGEAYCGLV